MIPYEKISRLAAIQAERTYSQLRLSCNALIEMHPVQKEKIKSFLSGMLIEAYAFDIKFSTEKERIKNENIT